MTPYISSPLWSKSTSLPSSRRSQNTGCGEEGGSTWRMTVPPFMWTTEVFLCLLLRPEVWRRPDLRSHESGDHGEQSKHSNRNSRGLNGCGGSHLFYIHLGISIACLLQQDLITDYFIKLLYYRLISYLSYLFYLSHMSYLYSLSYSLSTPVSPQSEISPNTL